MLTAIHPKLPMRNKAATVNYYVDQLGFRLCGSGDYHDYLMLKKDAIELHFFLYENLDPNENYGQVYIRTDAIETFYHDLLSRRIKIHPNGPLHKKPWGQLEFSLLDPDNNLLTFGEAVK
ncbi:VOC family protein [Pedobacter sp. SYP-B3415]|uniref:bleomycin resistance protein n=1 Tax=Pedobacter sp. SYP-B3415 TaxID=2496641 RepID=UPI00101D816D|nr:VOC family protein [Pedobacter sp. SYP-B3415]